MIDKNIKKYSEQLKKLGIKHNILEHPQLVSVEEVQKYLGYGLEDAGATLVMKADDRFVAIIRRGDTKLDSDKVKKLFGVESLRMATEEEFAQITGVPSGAASVIIPNLPTYIDRKVFEKKYINAGSGSLLVTMRYRSEDLKKIPGIQVVDISSKELTGKKEGKQQIITGKRLYSAITPSGDGTLHIGNYLGAVRQFKEMAMQNECFFQIASLHALSTVQNKKQLIKNVETLVINELSLLGDAVDNKKNKNGKIYFAFQPDIELHTELQSVLNNVTPLGLIKRAHAYKDKLAKDVMEDDINLGLFNYPILMAADILIYKAEVVPVGKDQKQHVEITRDIAEKFNRVYSSQLTVDGKKKRKDIFPLPEVYIPEEVATVIGTDGKRKMSKSLGNIISIFEPEEVIKKQVMGCYTDPTRKRATDPGHVEGNMVFAYLDFFGKKEEIDEMKENYRKGKMGDVEVKNYLYEILMKTFAPARKKYQEYTQNPKLVKNILEEGTQKAREVAGATMREVREAVGLVNKYSISNNQDTRNKPAFTKASAGMQIPNDKIQMLNQTQSLKSKIELEADKISIDEFAKVEIRVGNVEKAENVAKSEKLILLHVSFGELGTRTIYTGVRGFGYTPEDFAGKQFLFVVNLAYRKMPGGESQGMILAVDGDELPFGVHGEKKPIFVPAEGMPVGSKVR